MMTVSRWAVGVVVLLGSFCSRTAVQSAETIKYAVVTAVPTYAAYFVAQDKGMFSARGLQVETVNIDAGASLMAAIASGDIQVVGIGGSQILAAISRGAKIKFLANALCPYMNTVIVRADSPRKTLADLKGARFGITIRGSGTEAIASYVLRDAGMDPLKDVVYISLGNNPAAWKAAFENHQVDAALSFEPITTALTETDKLARVIVDYSETGLPKLPNACLGEFHASARWIETSPEQAKKFVESLQEATSYINDPANRADVARILSRDLKTPLPIIEKSLDIARNRFSTKMTKEIFDDTLTFAKGWGQVSSSTRLTYEDVIAPGITSNK
jgi:NitT/TauT family transport system substrate-binding protein